MALSSMTRGPLLLLLLLLVMLMLMLGVRAQGTNSNLTEAEEFLEMYNTQAERSYFQVTEKYWIYSTNITAENQMAAVESSLQFAEWSRNLSRLAAQFNATDFPPFIKRQFDFIANNRSETENDTRNLKKRSEVLAEMSTLYSTAKVCLKPGHCLPLDPDITQMFETSRDEKLLRRLWAGWRDESGKKMRQLYAQFVSLSNEASQSYGSEDTGASWRSWYETESFEQDVAALFEELQPFYKQLHAFVRRRLKKQYGEDVFPASGHIPAHLLGNMWAQSWYPLQDMLMPYPGKPLLDVTPHLIQQNYTARKIFETADDFFTSLGLEPMPQAFWDKSMLEKPKDGRQVACHASAWDFSNGIDFRVKQCTRVTMSDFGTAHHEMGHIEYFLLYKHLPVVFRGGANPGFHEAVGDTMLLSVETPKHLHKIGLLPTLVEDRESEMNFLMAMALNKIAFLPFGYLVDQWRWSVFRGDATPANYNQAWWDLRCKLQGVSPPVQRSENDFDPGAKYHIPNNTPYIRYFVANIIQFQFHKALCEAAGHQGPLHTCDIYNSTAAGDRLRAMLSKGSSEVWTVPFQALTGQTKMSAQPLIQYFQPLMDYLQEANRGEAVGWTKGCPKPKTDTVDNSAGRGSVTFLLLTLMFWVTVLVCSPSE